MIKKFRIWDRDYNKFWENGKSFSLQDLAISYHDLMVSDSFEFHQFTGILDKFGREIFEGDIVEYEVRSFFNEKILKLKYEIIWNNQEVDLKQRVARNVFDWLPRIQ